MVKYGLSLLALSAASPTFAQAPEQISDLSGNSTPIVVTASRVTSEAREIGSAVSIITRADIQRNQIIFLKDILQDAPGVQTTADRPGQLTSVRIRGSNNNEILWLIDGIELGDPSAISTQFQACLLYTSPSPRD